MRPKQIGKQLKWKNLYGFMKALTTNPSTNPPTNPPMDKPSYVRMHQKTSNQKVAFDNYDEAENIWNLLL